MFRQTEMRLVLLVFLVAFLTACTPDDAAVEGTRLGITAVSPTAPPATATILPTEIATAVYPPISLTETTPFTQTTHGYTLQYPVGFYPAGNSGVESDTNFATQPEAEDLIALSHQDFWITIRVEENPDHWSLDQWADWNLLPRGTEDLTVAGIPATQGSGDLAETGNSHGGFAIATYFVHDDQVFVVMGLALSPEALTYFTPAYQQLLDNFRLLAESDQPSDTAAPSVVSSCATDATAAPNLPKPTSLLRVLFLNKDLWLWKEETGTAVSLTKGGNVTAFRPAPDSSAVAYVQDGNLWILREDQSLLQVTEGSHIDDFLFSQDGELIAYSTALEDDQYEIVIANSKDASARWRETVSAADTWARHPDAEKVDLTFSWMDDTHILTWSFSPTLLGIGDTPPQPGFAVDADTGEALDSLPATAAPDSPYGYDITTVTQSDGQSELHLVSSADGETALVLPAVYFSLWTLSPDGRFLIASAPEGIVAVDLSDLSQWSAPVPYAAVGVSHYSTPSPSVWADESTWYATTPDGTDVFQQGATFTLWRVNLAEQSAEPVKSYSGSILDAEFSPDQQHLAFWEETGSGIRNLHLVNVATGEDSLYENGRINLLFDHWLSDSTHFVYNYQDGNQTCYQLGHISQPPVPVIVGAESGSSYAWPVDETRYVTVKDYLIGENSSSGTLYFQSLHGENTLIGAFAGTSENNFTPYFEEP